MSFASYAGNFGAVWVSGMPGYYVDCRVTSAVLGHELGMFNDLHNLGWRDVPDGLSKTVLFAERAATKIAVLNEVVVPSMPQMGDRLGWWVKGGFSHTLFTGNVPPNRSPNVAMGYVGERIWCAMSMHGGVYAQWRTVRCGSFRRDNSWPATMT